MSGILSKRFELVMNRREKKALEALAKHDGVSQGCVLRNMIRAAAKRKKVWK